MFLGNTSEKLFKDSFKIDVESILRTKENLSIKIANVYFYRQNAEDETSEPVITQILPTPTIRKIELDVTLTMGGILQSGDIILQNIPKSKYSRADLSTDSLEGADNRFFIIQKKAYSIFNIRESHLFWELLLRENDAFSDNLNLSGLSE